MIQPFFRAGSLSVHIAFKLVPIQVDKFGIRKII